MDRGLNYDFWGPQTLNTVLLSTSFSDDPPQISDRSCGKTKWTMDLKISGFSYLANSYYHSKKEKNRRRAAVHIPRVDMEWLSGSLIFIYHVDIFILYYLPYMHFKFAEITVKKWGAKDFTYAGPRLLF